MAKDEYSDYKPVETGSAPGTVKGRLPNEDSSGAFRYSHEINFYVSFASLGGALSKIVSAKFKFQIVSPDGVLLFESEVTLRFEVIVLSLGAGIAGFFWSPADGGDGRPKTTHAEGTPLSGDGSDGWKAVDDDTPSEYSEEGDFQFDLADAGLVTEDGGYIFGTWFSAPYKVEVPAGSTLKVIRDEWQNGRVREGSYEFSFKEGSEPGRLFDDVAALRFAVPQGGGAAIYHRFQTGTALGVMRSRFFLPGVSYATIAKTPDNAMWLLGAQATVGRLWFSENDGVTWSEYSLHVGGSVQRVIMFGSGFTNFDMQAGADGVLHAVAQKGSDLFYCRSDRPSETRQIGRVLKSGKYRIALGQGGAADMTIYVVNLDHEFVSDNGFTTPAAEKKPA